MAFDFSPPSEQESSVTDELDALTDADVEILHRIVIAAQDFPDAERLPFRALFAAYDQVLAQIGIDPDHDQVYFRFLFRMGDARIPGDTLYQKFEALLEQVGIVLEIDEDGSREVTREIGYPGSDFNDADVTTGNNSCDGPRTRPRAASVDTVYNIDGDTTQKSTRRALSLSPVSEVRRSSRAASWTPERTQPWGVSGMGVSFRESARNVQRSRTSNRSFSGGSNHRLPQYEDSSDRSESHQGKRNIPPKADIPTPSDTENRSATSTLQAESSRNSKPPLQHPSKAQMIVESSTFYFRRMMSGVVRTLFHKWRAAALQALEDHQWMEDLAIAHDRFTLLRAGFSNWRATLHEKRERDETERFFQKLEQRAGRARDLFLATKAFTHWAQCASVEVQRTSIARRHILRTRYFNAWRDITAVNELKVRRQGLSKFFNVWRSKTADVVANSVRAIDHYEQQTIKKTYWEWFWRFCESRAPEWWAARAKPKFFQKWMGALREQRMTEEWVEVVREQHVKKDVLNKWRNLTVERQSMEQKAEEFRRKQLMKRLSGDWNKMAHLEPLAAQITRKVNERRVRSYFNVWITHTGMERQAASINFLRLLRKSWTDWNDHLRARSIITRIDDRIALQVLNKLVLIQRSNILKRLFDQRIKEKVFRRMIDGVRSTGEKLSHRQHHLQGRRNTRILRVTFALWRQRREAQQEKEKIAFEFYASRVVRVIIQHCYNRLQHLMHLERWAKDSEFYFLTTKSIKRWRSAEVDSKRQKRRDAYALIRRKVKVNLAAKILGAWRQRTASETEMQNQAAGFYQEHLLKLREGIFAYWTHLSRKQTGGAVEAKQKYDKTLAHNQLKFWSSRLLEKRRMEQKADIYCEMHVSDFAAVTLRKLSLRVFEIRRRQETAGFLKERNQKKHFRNILRYWAGKAAERKRQKYARLFQGSTRRIEEVDTPGAIQARRAETWAAFEETLDLEEFVPEWEAQASMTPMPGYMSTPSKRSARTLALDRFLRALSMRAVQPGNPQARIQALCTGQWEGKRLIAYISGNALVVLGGIDHILQTVYHDEDEELEAVIFDEASARIATCAGRKIYVYQPYGRNEGALKWSLRCSLELDEDEGTITTLSWGSSEELLVGSSSLILYSIVDTPSVLWSRKLANPPRYAQFSYDSSLIASTGSYDRLMKIWRRQSLSPDDVRFDFTYLAHPASVTGMHWRRPFDPAQIVENILYTNCADNKLRIWASTDPHGLQFLQLCAEIDMEEAIKPRLSQSSVQSHTRYAFIIDSRDFAQAAGKAVQRQPESNEEHHGLHHLIEIANTTPEVCVVLDESGHMSAWGLEGNSAKAQDVMNVFNVAHTDGMPFQFMLGDPTAGFAKFYSFCGDGPKDCFTILAHHFDGRIEVFEGEVDDLFDPSPRSDRLRRVAVWSGHSHSVKKLVRTASGNALASRTVGNEILVWTQRAVAGTTLVRQSKVNIPDHIHRMCLLDEGSLTVLLHHDRISLWDTRLPRAVEIISCHYHLSGRPLCLIALPGTEARTEIAYVATISSEMKGIAWEIRLPSKRTAKETTNGQDEQVALKEYCSFDLGMEDDLAYVLPVDPAGSVSVISGFLDTFARDVAISYTCSGVLRSWTAKVNSEQHIIHWLLTSTVETSIENPSLASASSIRKTALVNAQRTSLTIWDTRGAQLEFEKAFDSEDAIQDLDWTSTPDDQSILAVGFPHKVLLLSQLRYDYLGVRPAWATIREIRIRDITPHPIGDSTWLGNGNLVIGTGNQLLVYDKKIDVSDKIVSDMRLPSPKPVPKDLFDIVSRLNGPLPVFHPQFLFQCILYGKSTLVQRILINLHKALKYFTEGDEIDSFLGISLDEFFLQLDEHPSIARKEVNSSYADFSDEEPQTVTEEIAASLCTKLTNITVPQLSSHEQLDLADIIECVATVERHRRSMDLNASRFLLFFRQHILRNARESAVSGSISWREIVWAYHSGSQDILIDLVSRQFQGKMTWGQARESGMFSWLTDITALRAQFEVIARNEYTKTDEKNPIDCSLFYLALHKKNVLLGLWRMATWHREQGSTQRLLANNFQEPRWKTAALKNAYALLGKRRFSYAAAFFILAGSLKDAVNVCINQIGDLQLAIAIARVYEGDDSPVLRQILEDRVLPQAARDGDRWLATWAFWMLNRRDLAVRALISPIYTLLEAPESPGLHAKLFLADDPPIVALYKQLRAKTLQTLRGASKVPPKVEWEFIMHTARLYDRMGCDLLALDLVRNWEFLQQPPDSKKGLEDVPDPHALLKRRSSIVVADLPAPPVPLRQQPAKVFEEPDSSSLLDNFGF
ncbi:MAG: hypothetical protein M1819_000475 [Sarea resinae]|nr:MAG: hypothetical protein M1819_000475 [Sarea resinae]